MGELCEDQEEQCCWPLRSRHAGTPPIGELGALSHLDSFVFSTHSPFDLVSSNSLDEPFGDEVPHNPTTTPTPHTTSQHSTHNQHKRQLRSQDARKSRQTRRIQQRAQARRAYRGWLSHFPDPQPPGGKGSTRRLHNSKPSYRPTPQIPSQGDRQPRNSCSYTSKKSPIWKCHKFRRRMQIFLKMKKTSSHNKYTPNHLRHHNTSSSTPHQLPPNTTHITDSSSINYPQDRNSNSSSIREQSCMPQLTLPTEPEQQQQQQSTMATATRHGYQATYQSTLVQAHPTPFTQRHGQA